MATVAVDGRNNMVVAKNISAGAVAGIAQTLIVHPLDVIRTRLQTANRFSGPVSCLAQTVKHEGFRALYKGMASPLVAQGLYKSVMFGSNSFAQRCLKSLKGPDAEGKLNVLELSICGAFAGGVNSFVVTPFELVRNRLIVQYHAVSPSATSAAAGSAQAPTYRGPLDVVRKVVGSEGVRGMWRGHSSTVLRDVPGLAAWFATSELCRRQLMALTLFAGSTAPPPVMLISGAMAGIGFWTVALPFDTVKSIVQTDLQHKYSGFVDCARKVVAEQGFRRLYQGYSVAILRGIPGAATTFTVHGLMMTYLNSTHA